MPEWHNPGVWLVALGIIQLVLIALSWVGRKEFATNRQADKDRERIVKAEHAIDLLKKDVANLPTHETVHELRQDIGELKEGQARTDTKIDGIDRTVNRIDEFLRQNR
jgi:uncharacterized membrane protein